VPRQTACPRARPLAPPADAVALVSAITIAMQVTIFRLDLPGRDLEEPRVVDYLSL
jgi:hypothetical protein